MPVFIFTNYLKTNYLLHVLMRLHPLQQLFNRRIRVALTPCDLKIKFSRAALRSEKLNHH